MSMSNISDLGQELDKHLCLLSVAVKLGDIGYVEELKSKLQDIQELMKCIESNRKKLAHNDKMYNLYW
jgi:hypothetical protein